MPLFKPTTYNPEAGHRWALGGHLSTGPAGDMGRLEAGWWSWRSWWVSLRIGARYIGIC